MKILKDRFYEIINALDGIRCDNRENKQYYDNENDLRQIPQDIMEYIERKGYCKYIYGANGRFVRTLTEKGYDVLQYMNYSKYKRRKSIANWKTRLSIGISIVALIASVYVAFFKPERIKPLTREELTKAIQIDSSLKSIKESINSLNLRMTRIQNPTKHL
jgi:hypothetical protein